MIWATAIPKNSGQCAISSTQPFCWRKWSILRASVRFDFGCLCLAIEIDSGSVSSSDEFSLFRPKLLCRATNRAMAIRNVSHGRERAFRISVRSRPLVVWIFEGRFWFCMIYDSTMQMYNCLTDSQNDLEFKGFIIHNVRSRASLQTRHWFFRVTVLCWQNPMYRTSLRLCDPYSDEATSEF